LNLKTNTYTKVFSRDKIDRIIFILLFFLGLFLAYNINFADKNHPQHKINSDKAYYYVYLPATFIYGWDVHKFPAGIEKKFGGFVFDYKNNKISDKMTCGVAILWAPFFLVTHFIAVQWNLQPDGFSEFYEKMTILPGVFYLVLGLFFLMKFLRNYFSRWISYITVFLIFVGTNLYYFGIDDGLMSHVNSFFLFALFLFLLKKFLNQEKKSFGLYIGMCFVVSLAILIRPTNILILLWVFFLDITSVKSLRQRILVFIKPSYIVAFIIISALVFLPQFIYWKYLTGNFVYYSYSNEGFQNWKNPLMIEFWFAPLNGFFLYTPLALLFIAGIVYMILKKIPNGIFIAFFFLLISYVFASWHMWYFGGSFGCRPLIEYYTILALPFGYFLYYLKSLKNLFIRSLLVLTIIVSVYYNLKLTYDPGWNPYSTWSWDDYFRHLEEAGLYHVNYDSYTYKQDFENFGSIEYQYPQRECVHSPGIGGYVNEVVQSNGFFMRQLDVMLRQPLKRVKASLWVNPGKKLKTDVQFICQIQDRKKNVYFMKVLNLDDFIKKPKTWSFASETIEIPAWINQQYNIAFYVWNAGGKSITYVDDITLKFEK
jgi:hypothetical protein